MRCTEMVFGTVDIQGDLWRRATRRAQEPEGEQQSVQVLLLRDAPDVGQLRHPAPGRPFPPFTVNPSTSGNGMTLTWAFGKQQRVVRASASHVTTKTSASVKTWASAPNA